ncbi:hypothetical protein GQ457_06G013730 [Hibiscus cannabinus]
MYRDLRQRYWWKGLKRDVVYFIGPYEALYGSKCHTPISWTKLTEKRLLRLELAQEAENTVKMIRGRLKTAFKKHKLYINLKRRDIEFIGPYHILLRVGPVAFRLELPPELQHIHDVFHVSMSRHYRSDPSHVLSIEEIEVSPDLTFEEPIRILAHDKESSKEQEHSHGKGLVEEPWY